MPGIQPIEEPPAPPAPPVMHPTRAKLSAHDPHAPSPAQTEAKPAEEAAIPVLVWRF